MTGWVPDIVDMIGYITLKIKQERRRLGMRDTTEKEILKAIHIYKKQYGIKTPLDMFKLDAIIDEMRKEK